MKKKIALLVAMTMVMGMALTGCGEKPAAVSSDAVVEDAIVYAVEAGSAGEAAAEGRRSRS